MSNTNVMRFNGLSVHNMASHLALLGIVRILNEDCKTLNARVHWSDVDGNYFSSLSIDGYLSESDICATLIEGLTNRANRYIKVLKTVECFTGKKFSSIDTSDFINCYRELGKNGDSVDIEFFCSIIPGVAKNNKVDEVSLSPLFMVEGQSRKYDGISKFLDAIGRIEEGKLHKSLFGGVWERLDDHTKFYWDYLEWSDQARNGRDTSNDDKRVELSINALAFVGFAGLGGVPLVTARFENPCYKKYDSRNGEMFYFPIWSSSATYESAKEILNSDFFRNFDKQHNPIQYNSIGVVNIVCMGILHGSKGRKVSRFGELLW